MILLNHDSLVNIVFLPVCCTFVSYVWCHIASLPTTNTTVNEVNYVPRMAVLRGPTTYT